MGQNGPGIDGSSVVALMGQIGPDIDGSSWVCGELGPLILMAAAVANPTPALVVVISSDTEEEEATERKDPGRNKRNKKSTMMTKKRRRRYSDVEIWTADEKELSDDDCCILPSDPIGGIELEKNAVVVDSDPRQQDDDVSVLAERGKVACRDYPHLRHSCAQYPFHKTSHENCCSQCYCYVCDVLAPCSYWEGTTGHCHASIDDKKWGVKRRAFCWAKKYMLNSCSQV